ncbi:MAG: alanine--tRNA ligase [Candidatus Nomurabacteria bacterium]|jgi:alanyl-tRNA synthetase|nr:alanine--tRNA ligase [Candidatus Nomurabacteria bacterium]
MKSHEIREKYVQFMSACGYAPVEPVGLVLDDDPTTLFTGSGMQPMVPYLLGQQHPNGTRLVNSQPCIRAQDMDEVGDNRHTTFFEMLGDWSLDGFSKKQQIEWLFEFLTVDLGLDPTKIYVSCFIGDEANGIPRDTETAKAWQDIFAAQGIPAEIAEVGSALDGDRRGMNAGERIFYYDDTQNWWSRNGGIATTPQGDPCGPDNEVFYDFGESAHDASYGAPHPASDSGRFMEICNKVWMQYRRQPDGSFAPLDQGKVDFGGGLSRLVAATLDTPDIFKTDLYQPIISALENLSSKNYNSNQAAMRVIADHLTGAVWLASQGLAPSNKEQGYVMRRLLRRAILRALDLGIEQDFLPQLVPGVIEIYSDSYPHFDALGDKIVTVLECEEQAFRKTLGRGLRELEKLAKYKPQLEGKDIFKLQDTYGFPRELAVEEIFRLGHKLSENWNAEFDDELTAQRQRSQTASKGTFKGGLEGDAEIHKRYHTATHLLGAALNQVLGVRVAQRGSHINDQRLRLDFTYDEKLSDQQISAVEKIVNQAITDDLPVSFGEYDTDYALDVMHATGEFRDKYSERVTVYIVGDPKTPFTVDICGGPHVKRTGELGKFKIIKEQSSSAGVRRIKAILA